MHSSFLVLHKVDKLEFLYSLHFENKVDSCQFHQFKCKTPLRFKTAQQFIGLATISN